MEKLPSPFPHWAAWVVRVIDVHSDAFQRQAEPGKNSLENAPVSSREADECQQGDFWREHRPHVGGRGKTSSLDGGYPSGGG